MIKTAMEVYYTENNSSYPDSNSMPNNSGYEGWNELVGNDGLLDTLDLEVADLNELKSKYNIKISRLLPTVLQVVVILIQLDSPVNPQTKNIF